MSPEPRSFEEIYARTEPADVSWAGMRPRPALLTWLDSRPDRPGASALVIACGFGDDAEELARRGYLVRAFDVAPTAIAHCHRRFPDSPVDYRVADLFALPPDWADGHDLVVEIQTIQSLPPDVRAATVAAIGATVREGGELFVRAAGRDDDEPTHGRPWPVSRSDLSPLAEQGLRETTFEDSRDPDGIRWFHASYRLTLPG